MKIGSGFPCRLKESAYDLFWFAYSKIELHELVSQPPPCCTVERSCPQRKAATAAAARMQCGVMRSPAAVLTESCECQTHLPRTCWRMFCMSVHRIGSKKEKESVAAT